MEMPYSVSMILNFKFISLASPLKRNVGGSPDIGIVNIAELRDIRAKTILGKQNDAIIIQQNELDRIKETMQMKSPAQLV